MELDINVLREEINEIDREMVDLFKKRMKVAASVAEYKKERGLPVLDAARERALLGKISDMAGEELDGYARTLYHTMLDVSRAYQYTKLNSKSSVYSDIKSSLKATTPMFPARARVACQGIEGAYSQIATEKLFELPEISYYKSFDDVFSAIESGECRYGVLPIENSTAGSVKKVYELMLEHKFNIVRSVRIKIDHNLLARKGTKIENIREIISHEQAINQCSSFMRTLKDVKITIAPNTAVAAQTVAKSGRNDIAALSSRACAELYSLDNLAEAVQDMGNNYTRFICISKEPEIYPGADKLTLMLVTPNKPGALYSVLSCFNALGVNMTKLESCPIPERDFESMFYFDFTVSVYSDNLERLLCELESRGERYRLLGAYSEII
ncbi:MAG: chorismate mutase [Clostridia bacterium]|nr:chorismate mutase [Clostridia bacterium]